jgi:hypothetical protein
MFREEQLFVMYRLKDALALTFGPVGVLLVLGTHTNAVML